MELAFGDLVYITKEPRGPENEYRIAEYSRSFVGRTNVMQIKPGIYRDVKYVILAPVRGNGVRMVSINSLQLVNPRSGNRREHTCANKEVNRFGLVYQAELPETKFWEGDFVRQIDSNDQSVYFVDCINYMLSRLKDRNGEPYKIYKITNNYSVVEASENQLELVRRGSIWDEAHLQSSIPKEIISCVTGLDLDCSY